MIVTKNFKDILAKELSQARSVWIASAMISNTGWIYLQENIPYATNQNYLIGVDLSTDPDVFEWLVNHPYIPARIYLSDYTFHPKVYIIEKLNSDLSAFIGSSNTTSWGLEKNIEMNFLITDQVECRELVNWFDELFKNGRLITDEFLKVYRIKFLKASNKLKEVNCEIFKMKNELKRDIIQFFSNNMHEVFNPKYHKIENPSLKSIRKAVRERFFELDKQIYPQFLSYGLQDLHRHHLSKEIVSRDYFNPYSGNYINAIWLHYGKSYSQLQYYKKKEEKSFINNIRIQVIIHEFSVGIWLIIGKNMGSLIDRDYIKSQLQNDKLSMKLYDLFKGLGDSYWIGGSTTIKANDIQSHQDLTTIINDQKIQEYFIIGTDINYLDQKLSDENIAHTVLLEFKKLYPLYEMMREKITPSIKSHSD